MIYTYKCIQYQTHIIVSKIQTNRKPRTLEVRDVRHKVLLVFENLLKFTSNLVAALRHL